MLGSIAVLLGTGTLMFFTGLAPLAMRTGATFVHDWVSITLGLLVLGHLHFAFSDREARTGMRTGRVDRRWALREHRAWVVEVERLDGLRRSDLEAHRDGTPT